MDNANFGAVVFFGILDPRIKGKPLERKEVRLALDLAVDKKLIVDTIFAGLGEVPARALVAPGSLGYTPDMKPQPYDVARAKQLLAGAGYANGFDLTVYNRAAPGAGWMLPMTEAVAGFWSAAGVRPRLLTVEYSSVFAKYQARPQTDDVIGAGITFFLRPTPTNLNFLRVFYHSKGTTQTYPSAEMDGLIDRAFAATDPKLQEQLVTQIANLAHDAAVMVNVALIPSLYAVNSKVGSWTAIPTVGVGVFLETVTP